MRSFRKTAFFQRKKLYAGHPIAAGSAFPGGSKTALSASFLLHKNGYGHVAIILKITGCDPPGFSCCRNILLPGSERLGCLPWGNKLRRPGLILQHHRIARKSDRKQTGSFVFWDFSFTLRRTGGVDRLANFFGLMGSLTRSVGGTGHW